MGSPTVERMLEDALKKGGFDGLYREGCGCVLGDLVPCGCDPSDCAAGYLQPDADDEATVGPVKHAIPDTQMSLLQESAQ